MDGAAAVAGMRREDIACLRAATAFVALARHSRLLVGDNGDDNDGDGRDAARMKIMISLPTRLPRQNASLPLNTNHLHLTHLLQLVTNRGRSDNEPKKKRYHAVDPRAVCLHLVRQLMHRPAMDRRAWLATHLNDLVAEQDRTVSPLRFILIEYFVAADPTMVEDLLPLVANRIVTIPAYRNIDPTTTTTTTQLLTTCEDLTVWAYCAEYLMGCLIHPTMTTTMDMVQLWQLQQQQGNNDAADNGDGDGGCSHTGWFDLHGMARDYLHYSRRRAMAASSTVSALKIDPTVELWRQHIVAHLAERALAIMAETTMEMDDEALDYDYGEGNGDDETF
jgi:hypothetical protein